MGAKVEGTGALWGTEVPDWTGMLVHLQGLLGFVGTKLFGTIIYYEVFCKSKRICIMYVGGKTKVNPYIPIACLKKEDVMVATEASMSLCHIPASLPPHGGPKPVSALNFCVYHLIIFFFFKILFIHESHTEGSRDTGRGRSRLHAGSLTWNLIPGLQDQALG